MFCFWKNQSTHCSLRDPGLLPGDGFMLMWTAHHSCWSQLLTSSFCLNASPRYALFFFYLKASINISYAILKSNLYWKCLVSHWKHGILSLNLHIISCFLCIYKWISWVQNTLHSTHRYSCNCTEGQQCRNWSPFLLLCIIWFYFFI